MCSSVYGIGKNFSVNKTTAVVITNIKMLLGTNYKCSINLSVVWNLNYIGPSSIVDVMRTMYPDRLLTHCSSLEL